jgi:hypothetical protein
VAIGCAQSLEPLHPFGMHGFIDSLLLPCFAVRASRSLGALRGAMSLN